LIHSLGVALDLINSAVSAIDEPTIVRHLLILAGAIVSYLITSYPEEDRVRNRLRMLFPSLPAAMIERWLFLTLLTLGYLVVGVMLKPTTNTEAFLAGFGWISLLGGVTRERDRPLSKPVSTDSPA